MLLRRITAPRLSGRLTSIVPTSRFVSRIAPSKNSNSNDSPCQLYSETLRPTAAMQTICAKKLFNRITREPEQRWSRSIMHSIIGRWTYSMRYGPTVNTFPSIIPLGASCPVSRTSANCTGKFLRGPLGCGSSSMTLLSTSVKKPSYLPAGSEGSFHRAMRQRLSRSEQAGCFNILGRTLDGDRFTTTVLSMMLMNLKITSGLYRAHDKRRFAVQHNT